VSYTRRGVTLSEPRYFMTSELIASSRFASGVVATSVCSSCENADTRRRRSSSFSEREGASTGIMLAASRSDMRHVRTMPMPMRRADIPSTRTDAAS
jgi:hypothetical protein